MSLVQVDELCIAYGATLAISRVSLRIEAGEIVTIVGPNGSGKTSLLRAIIGAIKPIKGQVSHARDLKIGYVPQSFILTKLYPLQLQGF
jgi:zinc transport system ATP-binding protein